jgi:DNA repair protein RadC
MKLDVFQMTINKKAADTLFSHGITNYGKLCEQTPEQLAAIKGIGAKTLAQLKKMIEEKTKASCFDFSDKPMD